MPRHLRQLLVSAPFLIVSSLLCRPALAQSVWSGFSYSFSKAAFADPTQAANQDRITSNVWLTRGNNQGLFNIHDEAGYGATSPAGTLWATDINNPAKTIAATNWSNLSFTDWVTAYDGPGGTTLPNNLLSRNAVVYLVADNVYLDLRFTGWGSMGGGAFAYERAPAPTPPPTTGDYNQNGVIDAADYVVWRNTLNQTVSPAGSGADGDSSGTIDIGDYSYWRARFGNTVSPGLGAANVPEPSAISFVAFALAMLHAARRTRRSCSRECRSR